MTGFIPTPSMDDLQRLERRVRELEQWVKGFEAGKGGVAQWPMPTLPHQAQDRHGWPTCKCGYTPTDANTPRQAEQKVDLHVRQGNAKGVTR